MGVDIAAAEEIDGCVPSGGEEKGLGVGEPGGVVDTEEAGVSLLHQIVVVGQGGKLTQKIGAKGGLVRVHVLGKPTGLTSGRHRGGPPGAGGGLLSLYLRGAGGCRVALRVDALCGKYSKLNQVQIARPASKGKAVA